jgi:hypothetical protein
MTLAEWVRQLKAAVESKPPQLGAIDMRRVLAPGFLPLHGEGLFRFDGVQAIHRVGMPPEAMSVAVWEVPKDSEGFQLNDFGMHLGAALTLATGRRIEVLNEVPLTVEGTIRRTFLSIGEVVDRRLVSPPRGDDLEPDFKKLVAQLASLSGKTETAIVTAIQLHYGAVLLFDRDLAAAYTLIVAGIETLSRQFGRPPSDWQAWDKASEWDEFAAQQGLSESQHEALRGRLMRDRQLRLKETFVNYVVEQLPDSFWSQPWDEYVYTVDMEAGMWGDGTWHSDKTMRDFIPQDRNLLAGALRKSYDARSGFVHEGRRTVNLWSQLFDFMRPAEANHALSFAVLRSILTCLIRAELDAHAQDYELPQLVMVREQPSGKDGD